MSDYVEYLVVKDNIILNHITGRKPVEIKEDGLEYIYGENFKVSIMEDIRIYEDIFTGEIKPLEQQAKEGVFIIPEGKKIVNNSLEDMSIEEQVEKGLKKLEPNQKLEKGKIIPKGYDELFKEGLITKEEYNKYIDDLRRQAYIEETDGIGWEVLEGTRSKEDWINLKNKIKEKFPKL